MSYERVLVAKTCCCQHKMGNLRKSDWRHFHNRPEAAKLAVVCQMGQIVKDGKRMKRLSVSVRVDEELSGW